MERYVMSSSQRNTNKCRAAFRAFSITFMDTMWVIIFKYISSAILSAKKKLLQKKNLKFIYSVYFLLLYDVLANNKKFPCNILIMMIKKNFFATRWIFLKKYFNWNEHNEVQVMHLARWKKKLQHFTSILHIVKCGFH